MYKGKICINTRGSFANGKVSSLTDKTWEELFWEAEKTDFSLSLPYFPGITYIYELCSPYNTVVEYYPEPFAKLLGAVLQDGTEIKNTYEGQTYECTTQEQVFELLETLKPTQEGFVIAQWNEETKTYIRKKCKTKTWVELSHLKDSALNTDNKLWNVVFSGDLGEVSTIFPHLKDKLEEKEKFYQNLISEVKNTFESIKHIEDQKEFAKEAIKHEYSGVLFQLKKDDTQFIPNLQKYIIKKY
jgi:hypothetical protein